MSIEKPPAGTRGGKTPPSLVNKLMMPVMMRIHRRGGDRFQGMALLYITTVGAHSGQQRTNPVARFEDGQGGWYVVASAGGAAQHPAWYHNLAAHPDQVWVEVGGTKRQVTVEQLSGMSAAKCGSRSSSRRYRGSGATRRRPTARSRCCVSPRCRDSTPLP